MQKIVTVNKQNISPSGFFQPRIAGGGKAAIALVDNVDTPIFGGVRIENFAAVVGGTVVNADGFKR